MSWSNILWVTRREAAPNLDREASPESSITTAQIEFAVERPLEIVILLMGNNTQECAAKLLTAIDFAKKLIGRRLALRISQ